MINSLAPQLLGQVLDTLSVRIFWKDRDSRFIGCNKLFAQDAGVSDPNEFVGKSDYYFYHPDQAEAFRADDADVMYSGEPKLGIVEKLTKIGGQVIWLETNKWPLRNDSGEVIGILGMYRDITAQRDADAEKCRECMAHLNAA